MPSPTTRPSSGRSSATASPSRISSAPRMSPTAASPPSSQTSKWLCLNAGNVAFELKEVVDREQMAWPVSSLARYMVLPPGQSLWDLIPDGQETPDPRQSQSPAGHRQWPLRLSALGRRRHLSACRCAKHCAQSRWRLAARHETCHGKPAKRAFRIHGLETLEEQFSIFAAMPLEQQLAYLMSVARSAANVPDQFETLISLYQQRRDHRHDPADAEAPADRSPKRRRCSPMSNATSSSSAITAWPSAPVPLLETGNAFIAVGALHLPGEEGLVELLRQGRLQADTRQLSSAAVPVIDLVTSDPQPPQTRRRLRHRRRHRRHCHRPRTGRARH